MDGEEANPQRGLEFARELAGRKNSKSKVSDPFVFGAVISLGLCLDLTTSAGISLVKATYVTAKKIFSSANLVMPKNNQDGLRRNLDCAIINLLHLIREDDGEQKVDTIKGVFIEGKPAYPEAGFHEKTHIQICVRNPACIKGVFRVPS